MRSRVEVTLGATLGLIKAPEGPLGGVLARLPNEMRWDDLDYQADLGDSIRFAAGVRVAVGCFDWLEMRGGWYASARDSAPQAGVFAFFPGPAGTGGVSDPNTARFTGEADLYGGEVNYIGRLATLPCQRFSYVAGARFVRFDETVAATGWGAPFPGLMGSPGIHSAVDNSYIAGQLGLSYERDLSRCLKLYGRVTGLIGSMRNDIVVRDESFFAPGAHSARLEASNLALGGELQLGLRYVLSSRLALDAGYQLLILDEIVRANDAMDFTQSNTGAVQAIRRTDTLVAHVFLVGFTVGF